MKRITGAQAVMESLQEQGVRVIFGYPGGAIMPIYDALYDYKDSIHHILVRHEQGAAHAAEGYARITGRPGVCFATSGPGATNLVTGITDAMMDSVPLVCITGQVAAEVLGTDAFQEADVIGITTPITKWNYQVTSPDEIPEAIAKAFAIAGSGRPGPVLVDITKNAQFGTFAYTPVKVKKAYKQLPKPDPKNIKEAAQLLKAAKRPFVLLGHGVLISHAQEAVKAFIEKGGYPTAVTLHGLSSIPTSHPLYVGMLGMHGNYATNKLTNKADVIVAIGMRFDDRVTGRVKDYAPHAQIVHIDIDPAEINKNVSVKVGIAADCRAALTLLTPKIPERSYIHWHNEFKKLMDLEHDKVWKKELAPTSGELKMAEVVSLLSEATNGKAVIVADVGQHQMAAARYYNFATTDSFITSGGLGTMGFALPASIGARIAEKKRQVIAIIGDGSFQMTLQELGTIAQEKLPVKIVLLNNNFLGMVRQWQQLFFEKRYSFVHLENPDFVKISDAFGIPAERVDTRQDMRFAVTRMIRSKGPYLLDIRVAKEDNVFPMVPSGASVDEVRLE